MCVDTGDVHQYIIGSPTSGAIVSRHRTATAFAMHIGDTEEGATSSDDWYLVQTNDDINGPPVDNRRYAGIASMHNVTCAKVELDSLWGVLVCGVCVTVCAWC